MQKISDKNVVLFVQWVQKHLPAVYAGLEAQSSGVPNELSGIADIFSSIGSGISSVVSSVGTLANSGALSNLLTVAAPYIGNNQQTAALNAQIARLRSDNPPLPTGTAVVANSPNAIAAGGPATVAVPVVKTDWVKWVFIGGGSLLALFVGYRIFAKRR